MVRLFVTPPTTSLSGEVRVPSSKYHEHRALMLASLAEGTSRIRGVSGARHVEFTRMLLSGLGTRITRTEDGVAVTGGPYRPRRDKVSVGSSGTTLYFMIGLAALGDRPVTIVGQKYFRRRPVGPLLAALHTLGVRFDSADGRPPITVYPGRPSGGSVRIPGVLSQWVSGLLLVAPFGTAPTVVEVDGELNERPYVDLTINMMARFGLQVRASADRRRFEIENGQVPHAADLTLPPDLGSAAFGLATAAMHRSDVFFRGLCSTDPAAVDHPESDLLGVLAEMGLPMELDPAGHGIRVRQDGSSLTPFWADCRRMPDMLPILTTLATFAGGTSTLANVDHLRLKESDRVAAMMQLNRMGGRLELLGDRLLVRGTGRLDGAELSSFNDHRVLMALAVAATRARGGSTIKNATAYRLSYPAFIDDLVGIGIPLYLGPASGKPKSPVGVGDRPTIVDRVAKLARDRPNELAVVDVRREGDRCLHWAELNDRACRVATFLRSIGVRVGDKVAYQLPNWIEFVIITLGALRVGAVCMPLMPMFRERELRQTLSLSGAEVLFIPGRFRGRNHRAEINALAHESGKLPLKHVVVVAAEDDGPLIDNESLRWHDFDSAVAGQHAGFVASVATPDLIAQLLFTSGTTGEPKGVLHRHSSLDLATEAQIRRACLGRDDVVFVPSPLAHQTGFLYGMWLAVMLGVPQVLQAEWDAGVAAAAIERRQVSFVQAATPFLADLVEESERGGRRRAGPRTFVATGASVPRALAERARAHWRTAVGGAWGTTETCLGTSFAPEDPPHKQWGTDGRALDVVEIRVTDDEGKQVGPATDGNLETRGATLFEGYLNRPELTAAAFTDDGWYQTGDLAMIDDDGYVRITGRVKDIINRGGEKVPVAEVEQLLHEHPAVAETAVVAMPDERLGERACAFVVLRPDSELHFETMRKFLDSRQLSKTYWPERLEILDTLPRNATGKIQKNVLREWASASTSPRAGEDLMRPIIPAAFDETAFDETAFAALKAEIADFVTGDGERYADHIERHGTVPDELRVELRKRGYLGLTAPREYGGQAVPFERYLELMELFAMSHGSIRMIVHVANGIWRAVDQFATAEQRQRFVVPSVSGDIRISFALTEPTAGTGADLRSTVLQAGDHYLLTGEKHLITFGVHCDYWLLLARLLGSEGKAGTVALMVDRRTPGVTVNPMPLTMGMRGTDHAHLVFDNARVPVANRLGDEGDGLVVALGGFLTPSRISVAMSCVGLARRAHELAVEHARRRETFGKKLAERQVVRFMLAENATDIEASRRLVLHAGQHWQSGGPDAAMLSSMAKLHAVDALTRVTDRSLQIHGGIGYWESSTIERVYRDARAQRFEEGTNEIQKTVIAYSVIEGAALP